MPKKSTKKKTKSKPKMRMMAMLVGPGTTPPPKADDDV
jgi:hypothetical protein